MYSFLFASSFPVPSVWADRVMLFPMGNVNLFVVRLFLGLIQFQTDHARDPVNELQAKQIADDINQQCK